MFLLARPCFWDARKRCNSAGVVAISRSHDTLCLGIGRWIWAMMLQPPLYLRPRSGVLVFIAVVRVVAWGREICSAVSLEWDASLVFCRRILRCSRRRFCHCRGALLRVRLGRVGRTDTRSLRIVGRGWRRAGSRSRPQRTQCRRSRCGQTRPRRRSSTCRSSLACSLARGSCSERLSSRSRL